MPQVHSDRNNTTLLPSYVSFQHEQQQIERPSVTPPSFSPRVLPGAGLGDGASGSAEQHDGAGEIHQAGTALAPLRGPPAVETGPQPICTTETEIERKTFAWELELG